MSEKKELIRAYNIIWDFSNDYKIKDETIENMENPYKNIITGYRYQVFDMKMVRSFLEYLKVDNSFYEDFKFMVNLLIEELTYEKLKDKNLVIKDLRLAYARKILSKYTRKNPNNLNEQFEKAYYTSLLNKPIVEGRLFKDIYLSLFSIKSYDTSVLLKQLDQFFKNHFRFDRSAKLSEKFDKMIDDKNPKDFNDEEKNDTSEYSDKFIEEQFSIGSAEFTGNIFLEEKKQDQNKNIFFIDSKDKLYTGSSEFIENFYGLSIMPESKVKHIEEKVTSDIHKGKKLYFTRGEYSNKPNAIFYKKARDEQYEITKSYIKSNMAINNRSINELSLGIKNSIYNFKEDSLRRNNYGMINTGKAWRVNLLHDFNIFDHIEDDDMTRFKVDLLLDGSASQIKRAALVANEAYIIEKSMDMVNIPIRVMSFSTLKDHTVFNIYRDYHEKENNEKIFKYFASGSNRDGLALKTLNEMIDVEEDLKHILIILSDGKPHDEKNNINTKKLKYKDQYIDDNAIKDTAKELRNLENKGIATLGVFTGEEEDVKNAKLIYGSNFCRIKSLENFSKIVSIFMKNQIINK